MSSLYAPGSSVWFHTLVHGHWLWLFSSDKGKKYMRIYICVYILCVCACLWREQPVRFPVRSGVAHCIFMMRRVGEHRLNRCERTLRMTLWPKQLMRRSISMGNIQLYHAKIQATAAVFHRNTVSSKKQQLRENSRDAYAIHPVLKCFTACHTYMGEMETHISYRFLPLAVCIYTLSSVPSETQLLTVYTALKYQ